MLHKFTCQNYNQYETSGPKNLFILFIYLFIIYLLYPQSLYERSYG